jgi:hypothetical protein
VRLGLFGEPGWILLLPARSCFSDFVGNQSRGQLLERNRRNIPLFLTCVYLGFKHDFPFHTVEKEDKVLVDAMHNHKPALWNVFLGGEI